MSLSLKKHGASLIFQDIDRNTESKMVKYQKIEFENRRFMEVLNSRQDMFLLDSIVNPDGAVIFSSDLVPIYIATILPIDQNLV